MTGDPDRDEGETPDRCGPDEGVVVRGPAASTTAPRPPPNRAAIRWFAAPTPSSDPRPVAAAGPIPHPTRPGRPTNEATLPREDGMATTAGAPPRWHGDPRRRVMTTGRTKATTLRVAGMAPVVGVAPSRRRWMGLARGEPTKPRSSRWKPSRRSGGSCRRRAETIARVDRTNNATIIGGKGSYRSQGCRRVPRTPRAAPSAREGRPGHREASPPVRSSRNGQLGRDHPGMADRRLVKDPGGFPPCPFRMTIVTCRASRRHFPQNPSRWPGRTLFQHRPHAATSEPARGGRADGTIRPIQTDKIAKDRGCPGLKIPIMAQYSTNANQPTVFGGIDPTVGPI